MSKQSIYKVKPFSQNHIPQYLRVTQYYNVIITIHYIGTKSNKSLFGCVMFSGKKTANCS